MAAIAGVGVLRFILTVAGFPDSSVKYVSMTVVIFAGTVYFAFATGSHKERFFAAYLLILPYLLIEVAALGYTWATGHQTIFHAREYSFGFSIAQHTIGHLIGGLTWEPLALFVAMELLWAGRAVLRLLFKS
jgi:hypothetical protein